MSVIEFKYDQAKHRFDVKSSFNMCDSVNGVSTSGSVWERTMRAHIACLENQDHFTVCVSHNVAMNHCIYLTESGPDFEKWPRRYATPAKFIMDDYTVSYVFCNGTNENDVINGWSVYEFQREAGLPVLK